MASGDGFGQAHDLQSVTRGGCGQVHAPRTAVLCSAGSCSGSQDRLARDLFSVPDSAVFPWQQKPAQAEQPGAVTPIEDPWDKQIRPFMERIVVDAIGTDPKGTAQRSSRTGSCRWAMCCRSSRARKQYEVKVKEIHSNSVVLEWQDMRSL